MTSWKSSTETSLDDDDDDAELDPPMFIVRTPVPAPFIDNPLVLARRTGGKLAPWPSAAYKASAKKEVVTGTEATIAAVRERRETERNKKESRRGGEGGKEDGVPHDLRAALHIETQRCEGTAPRHATIRRSVRRNYSCVILVVRPTLESSEARPIGRLLAGTPSGRLKAMSGPSHQEYDANSPAETLSSPPVRNALLGSLLRAHQAAIIVACCSPARDRHRELAAPAVQLVVRGDLHEAGGPEWRQRLGRWRRQWAPA